MFTVDTCVVTVVVNIQNGKECQELSVGQPNCRYHQWTSQFIERKVQLCFQIWIVDFTVRMTCHPSHPKLMRWTLRSWVGKALPLYCTALHCESILSLSGRETEELLEGFGATGKFDAISRTGYFEHGPRPQQLLPRSQFLHFAFVLAIRNAELRMHGHLGALSTYPSRCAHDAIRRQFGVSSWSNWSKRDTETS